MATERSLKEKLDIIDKITAGINSKAKRVVAGRISNNEEIMKKLGIEFIPTPSQNVNTVLGGGFPKGRTTIIAGMADSGKTSLVLETIGLAMKNNPNFVAAWLESENSLELNYVCKTHGIDPERFIYIEHNSQDAGEGALDQIQAILAANVCDMVCINSLKCLVPSEEFAKDFNSVQVGAQARMNAKMMRKFTSLVTESNAAFVIVTHLTTQIGSMSKDPMIVAGGNAIMFGACIIMDMRKRSILEGDPVKKEEGIKISVTIKKNHAVPDRNPYLKTEYYAIFGEGIEKYLEALENAVNQNILIKSGAFIKDLDPETGDPKVLPDGTKLQWQGKDQFRQYCINNPDYFNELLNKINGNTTQLDAVEISDIENEMDEIVSSLPEEFKEEMKSSSRGRKKKS